MGFFSQNDDAAISAKLHRIERKLDAIIAHLNIPLSDDGMDDIRDLIAAGKKIEAIKEYRNRTGAGLAEAKQIIDGGL